MKKHLGKIKMAILGVTAGALTFMSVAFTDSYFEISKNLDIFATLYRELNIYYVDETSPGQLMKKGIDSMLESLDPYTTYIPESEIEDLRFMTTGEYGGIGALIRQSGDFVMIAEPYQNFPAHKSDLRAGDKIIEINGKSAKGKSTSDISKILKGQPNTTVTLLIEREGMEPFEKNVVRQEIKINNVPYYGMLEDKTGYIKLTGFTETASKEVKEAFIDLRDNQQMDKLVLDLRGNGGGLLREAVNIVNFFVNKGEEVVSTRGKVKEWDRVHRALNQPLDTKIPLVILVDGGSASASEIVAGSLQDLDRAVVIGDDTYGKGLVQQTRPLSYNSQLKITVAKYYTPSGRCIQKIDYSHKDEDGKAHTVADSLIRKFQTRNGRPVFDGKGIAPDIATKDEEYSDILVALASKNHIFDFATNYRNAHPTIAEPEKFSLTDAEYEAFVKSLNGKDYSYVSETENLLKKLRETAEKEKRFDELSAQFDALETGMSSTKNSDLYKFKSEIVEILENEIVSRYYFQNGRIRTALKYDAEIDSALKTLSSSNNYASVLGGGYGSVSKN